MKILITGDQGFVGSYLAEKLVSEGHDVFGYDIKSGYDILDSTTLRRRIMVNNIEQIYHLASCTGVEWCEKNARKVISTSVIGTQNIIDCAKNSKVKKIVFTSSCEVYGNQHGDLREDIQTQPISDYAVAKLMAERLLLAEDYGFEINIVRLFNVYGYGQRHCFVIPKFIREAICNLNLYVYDKNTSRSFTYIDDAVNGLLAVMNKGVNSEIYNIGNEEEYYVKDVAALIKFHTTSGSKIIINKEIRKEPIVNRQCHAGKIYRDLAFIARINIEDGLKQTIERFKNG